MFFKYNCFILVIFIQQLAVRCDDSLSECLKDPYNAASKYDKKFKGYMDYFVTIRAYKIQQISRHLQNMQLDPKCISRYYSTYSALDYNVLGDAVCGLVSVRHNFDGPWKTQPNATAQEICSFLEVKGVIGVELIEHDNAVLANCDVSKWFREIFYKSWEDCNQCS